MLLRSCWRLKMIYLKNNINIPIKKFFDDTLNRWDQIIKNETKGE